MGQHIQRETIVPLAEFLPAFVSARRWYRAKARTIVQLSIRDVVPLPASNSAVIVLQIGYPEGDSDTYLLPVSAQQSTDTKQAASNEHVIAEIEASDGTKGFLYDALQNERFCDDLLDAIACEQTFKGEDGELVASHTQAFDRPCGESAPRLKSSVSRAEQSNSSVIFGDKYILKLFRKVEAGINPDIEIGRFLTERGFRHSPAVFGTIEYRSASGESYNAALLQALVANEGDAWKYTIGIACRIF